MTKEAYLLVKKEKQFDQSQKFLDEVEKVLDEFDVNGGKDTDESKENLQTFTAKLNDI